MFNSRSNSSKDLNNPAKYRHPIVFEEFESIRTPEGHRVEEWVTSSLGSSYAQIRNIRGNEFIMAGANQVKVSARINMRYRADVVAKDFELGDKLRIKLGQRVFNIEYINNLEERNIELEILVNEVR